MIDPNNFEMPYTAVKEEDMIPISLFLKFNVSIKSVLANVNDFLVTLYDKCI